MRPLARREAEAALVTVQQEKQDALAACRRLELEVHFPMPRWHGFL